MSEFLAFLRDCWPHLREFLIDAVGVLVWLVLVACILFGLGKRY